MRRNLLLLVVLFACLLTCGALFAKPQPRTAIIEYKVFRNGQPVRYKINPLKAPIGQDTTVMSGTELPIAPDRYEDVGRILTVTATLDKDILIIDGTMSFSELIKGSTAWTDNVYCSSLSGQKWLFRIRVTDPDAWYPTPILKNGYSLKFKAHVE